MRFTNNPAQYSCMLKLAKLTDNMKLRNQSVGGQERFQLSPMRRTPIKQEPVTQDMLTKGQPGISSRGIKSEVGEERTTPPNGTRIHMIENPNPEGGKRVKTEDLETILRPAEMIVGAPQEETLESCMLPELYGRPEEPDTTGLAKELLVAYASAIPFVKNGLISFLRAAELKDVSLMITQANNCFSILNSLKANYSSFYDVVRCYIRDCSKLCAAEEALHKNTEAIELVSLHQKLRNKMKVTWEASLDVVPKLVEAKENLAALEAQVQGTRELLDKHEAELQKKKAEVADLEDRNIKLLDEFHVTAKKEQDIASKAKEAENAITEIIHDKEVAIAAVEKSKAKLVYS
ncbi:hypothetical protein Tsubulata_007037 [Turnera subulata]|uniref:Uncharacterized protein n=1 Tax=Turnera subulata TaxID=218843 RepID=A0A9Q0FCX8_9ROSI|nr:hypothetical protein Tsubulata_007037 [Turnera subulata]